jgi:hypothetical protein
LESPGGSPESKQAKPDAQPWMFLEGLSSTMLWVHWAIRSISAEASAAQGSPFKPCGSSRSFVLFHGLDAILAAWFLAVRRRNGRTAGLQFEPCATRDVPSDFSISQLKDIRRTSSSHFASEPAGIGASGRLSPSRFVHPLVRQARRAASPRNRSAVRLPTTTRFSGVG